MLAQLGVSFDIVTAAVTEHEAHDSDPRHLVQHNAAIKAEWVSARHPEALVLGADTTVCIDGHVLNKPADLADARAMLRRLSGRAHSVFTGLALRRSADGWRADAIVESQVTFKPLEEASITDYLARVHTLDKAGGYAIQEHPELIIASYSGSLTNIVGLPVEETRTLLTRAGLMR